MGCNCKAKKDSEKIIRTVEEMNKTKSVSLNNRNKLLMKTAFKSLSILIYGIFGMLFATFFIPFMIYAIITKRTFTIRASKKTYNEQ